MKTTARQNRRARFAATAFAALILTTLSWAQPGPFRYNRTADNPLEKLAYATGPVELFYAHETHAFSESAALAMYKARLSAWAIETAEMLKYKAPSIEAVEVREAHAGLESSASAVLQSLRYEAPAIEFVEAIEARHKIDVFADNCMSNLRYVAPSVEETEARQKISVFADKCMENLRYVAPDAEGSR